jgi:hypothetical protein
MAKIETQTDFAAGSKTNLEGASAMPIPPQGLAHIPTHARGNLVDNPKHSYTTVNYQGENGGVPVSGTFVEVDSKTWVQNGLFTFTEISETKKHVVLYDQSRDVTVTINFLTDDLLVSFGNTHLVWDVTGVAHSLTAGSSTSLLVDFEDVTPLFGDGLGGFLPVEYKGFMWDTPQVEFDFEGTQVEYGLVVDNDTDTRPFEGVGKVVSQEPGDLYVWTNGGTSPVNITRTDGSDFDFESGYFVMASGLPGEAQMLTLQGWNNGVMVDNTTVTLTLNQPQLVQVDWGDIDQLVIDANAANLAFDNLLFSSVG